MLGNCSTMVLERATGRCALLLGAAISDLAGFVRWMQP